MYIKVIQVSLQCMIFIFLYVSKHVTSLVIRKVQWALSSSGNFSISYQRPLVVEHGLNIRLNNKTSCMTLHTHYLCHALLFQCIFACDYKRLSSLLTIRRLIVSKQLRKNSWIRYESCLLCCSIQFSWSAAIPFVDTITKGHSHSYESGFACTS